jgi:hypothetical protein
LHWPNSHRFSRVVHLSRRTQCQHTRQEERCCVAMVRRFRATPYQNIVRNKGVSGFTGDQDDTQASLVVSCVPAISLLEKVTESSGQSHSTVAQHVCGRHVRHRADDAQEAVQASLSLSINKRSCKSDAELWASYWTLDMAYTVIFVSCLKAAVMQASSVRSAHAGWIATRAAGTYTDLRGTDLSAARFDTEYSVAREVRVRNWCRMLVQSRSASRICQSHPI